MMQRSINRTLSRLGVAIAVVAVCAVAPSIGGAAQPPVGLDVILVLDDSGSMRNNDPDRRSLRALTEFVLQQDREDRIGLVLFAGEARMVAPLTWLTEPGKAEVLASLSEVGFDGRRTDTAAAVERAIYELSFQLRDDAQRAIILISDGVLDTGSPERDLARGRWLEDVLSRNAAEADIRIYSIAVSERADFQVLHTLANTTRGAYYRVLDGSQIGEVVDRIAADLRSTMTTAAAVAAEPTAPVDTLPSSTEPASRADDPVDPELVETLGGEEGAAEPGAPSLMEVILSDWRTYAALGVMLLLFAGLAYWYRVTHGTPSIMRRVMARLRPVSGKTHGVLYDVSDEADVKRYELGDRVTIIGRVAGHDPEQQYIVVRERTVGRRHAALERRGEIYWIRDENSVNGTFINGKRIRGEQPLKHGDSVVVHKHKFLFVVPELIGSDKTLMEYDSLVEQAARG